MTLDLLRCPYCASSDTLTAAEAEWRLVDYQDGARREMVSGRLVCPGCGAAFPVADYVPSFAAALPQDVRADADYWGRYYAGEAAKGNHTYMEPRLARAGRAAAAYDPEAFILRHPLLKERGRCLDLGCGSGWTTLMLGREGFAAVGLEPALGSVVVAKRYAMEQGTPVDYVCGAPGYVHLAAGAMDAVFAFHSLHHVPDLLDVMPQITGWLKTGGVLAVDEHVQSRPQYWELAGLIGSQLGVPKSPPSTGAEPSANEDCSQAAVLPAIATHLHVADLKFRHVAFDGVADWASGGEAPSDAVLDLARGLSNAVAEWRPGDVEYATVLAIKGAQPPGAEDRRALEAKVPAPLWPLFDCGRATGSVGGHTWGARLRRAYRLLLARGPKALLREAAGYWHWRLGQ